LPTVLSASIGQRRFGQHLFRLGILSLDGFQAFRFINLQTAIFLPAEIGHGVEGAVGGFAQNRHDFFGHMLFQQVRSSDWI
jgi:hypothetical protein